MIRAMVARLADKLKQDGSDLDGWQRLLRAYVVLGERDKAVAAARPRARRWRAMRASCASSKTRSKRSGLRADQAARGARARSRSMHSQTPPSAADCTRMRRSRMTPP